jgi:hypothetical protein
MTDAHMNGPGSSDPLANLLLDPATKRICRLTVLGLTAMLAGAWSQRRHGNVWTEHANHFDLGTVALREKLRDEERGISGRLTVAGDKQSL